MNHLVVVPILLPLVTGVLLLLLADRSIRLSRIVSLFSAVALVGVCSLLVVSASRDNIEVYAVGNWAPPFGIALVLDRLSALMLGVTSVLALFSLGFATRGEDTRGSNLHSLVHFLLMGVNGAFLTGDLFNLFVFFEVLLLASYALLLHGGGPARVRAGLHYVILNLTGSSLFLIAAAMLYGLTGTLNMADMAQRVASLNPEDAPLVAAAGALLLVVFGLKAAIVPLYFWLPRAYASAAAPVAALFAIMTKVGVYAIIRVYPLIFGDSAGGIAHFALYWLWPLALLTLVLGFIGVLSATGLKMQIAYLVIISVGTLLAGVALNNPYALSATLYYLVHSTWICGALFLLADLIARQRGLLTDTVVSGPPLLQSALLGSLFFIGAASVAGIPPLSGFIGKLMLLQSTGTGAEAGWLWSVVLISGLVSIIALSRTGSTLFWRTSGAADGSPPPDRISLWITVALLALGPLLVIFGQTVMNYTDALAQQLSEPAAYIDAVMNHRPVQGD